MNDMKLIIVSHFGYHILVYSPGCLTEMSFFLFLFFNPDTDKTD